ncbi:hypothetical protein [Methylobacterium sp. V23]|uniref:hypothetical protein n=1 Tax=Methylobacterium sp. V23 TaxID=2044878 RepID=UPI000CDAEFFC|nr:hypothetical protein [Methylobacterium sp. V23]POR42670.1 hypothetical protein CRT23_12905 [Methylobacterium sp. V23]
MAIHEVWVKRVRVIEETACIPVEIGKDELIDLSVISDAAATLRIAKQKAISACIDMIDDGTWDKIADVKVLVAGPPEIDRIVRDVVPD